MGLMLLLSPTAGCARENARMPVVAGTFYPADRVTLQRDVDRYLAAVPAFPVTEGRLLALLVPHAGYIYSGPTAAFSYARLRGKEISTVILIGPSHQAPVRGAAVYDSGSWETPLGAVRINSTLARSLVSQKDEVISSQASFAREHSLEVQIPFLQRTLKEFTIVPILIGQPTQASYRFLADRIATILREDEKVILVISTDFSHYYDRATAEAKDKPALKSLQRMALAEFEGLISSRKSELCGDGATLYGLSAARGAGATFGTLYNYADSGEASGDTKKVVGYGAMGFYSRPLPPEARAELLALAKETVKRQVNREPLPVWQGNDPQLAADGAAFVTLKRNNGALRGCIGHIQPRTSLANSIIENAVAASSRDPRFTPVLPTELPGLDIEVTVLSPMEPLNSIESIVIGRDGLYLESGGRSSVFLPQVPREQGWNRETYLSELAMKAGLPPDGWKSGRLYRFTAEIIH